MEEIKLYSHNEEAYEAMINSLENSNFSFIERATGTGKSYILIKYLAMQQKGKRVLFVTTHEPMFNQLVNRDMPSLGVSKKMFKKMDLVIYPNLPKKEAQWYYDNYDCIIFDEAHHCGAPLWGETVGALRDLVGTSNDKVMIGATATCTRYLDNYMNVAEVFFDNNVASKLTLAQAILKEILPAPLYVNVLYSLMNDIQSVQDKLNKIGYNPSLNDLKKEVANIKDSLDIKFDENTLLKQSDVKPGEKYVVFCSNINDLKVKQQEAQRWFSGIGEIEVFEAHSGLSKEVTQRQIDEFSKPSDGKIKLMFAVDMFNEGMHISGVDGVIMTRRTLSPIVYLQQIGRALSFSVRKKQIKIFDFVGNATSIDVIYDLYKELLFEANEQLKANPEDKEHFERIIERFKIIEKGNEVVDRIREIEELLNNNYILKNQINKNICILEEYSSIHNNDFMIKYKEGKVDKYYLYAYDILCKNCNNLSINDLVRLNDIDIQVAKWQHDEEILEEIKNNGSYNKTISNRYNNYINKYMEFYAINGRRPDVNNEEEKDIVVKYREALAELRKDKLKKVLSNSPYRLNLEETIVIGGFPNYNVIIEYFSVLEKKFSEGHNLDSLEFKVLKSSNKLLNINDRFPIFKTILYSKTTKIDESIKILREYVSELNLNYVSCKDIKLDSNAYRAYKYIIKYYKFVSLLQFKELCNLNIELPKELDYSYEEFEDLLNGFINLNEKEEKKSRNAFNLVAKYVRTEKVRPVKGVCSEQVYNAYLSVIGSNNHNWYANLCREFSDNNIQLNVYEKSLIDCELTYDEITTLLNEIISKLKECDKETYNEKYFHRIIKLINSTHFYDNRLINILNRTNNVINLVFKYIDNDNKTSQDKRLLEIALWNNKDIIPFNLLGYIRKCGITIPDAMYTLLNKTTSINLGYDKYKQALSNYYKYLTYVKENGKRPDDILLSNYLIDYLLKSSLKDRLNFVKMMNDFRVPVLDIELYLCNQLTPASEEKLYNDLKKKVENDIKLNKLEKYVFEILNLQYLLNYEQKVTNGSGSEFYLETKNYTEECFMEQIKLMIKNDVNYELDFDGELAILTDKEKEELIKYKVSLVAKKFLNKTLDLLIKNKKSIGELLNYQDLKLLDDIRLYCKDDIEISSKLEQIDSLNKEIVLLNNAIVINDFVSEYVNYIKSIGRLPEISSIDEKERIIASQLEIISTIISDEEYQKIINIGKKTLKNVNRVSLYDRLINFFNIYERAPSILSEEIDEQKLAEEYQKFGSKLSYDQKKQINILMKKYQMNTVMYYKKKKGV